MVFNIDKELYFSACLITNFRIRSYDWLLSYITLKINDNLAIPGHEVWNELPEKKIGENKFKIF